MSLDELLTLLVRDRRVVVEEAVVANALRLRTGTTSVEVTMSVARVVLIAHARLQALGIERVDLRVCRVERLVRRGRRGWGARRPRPRKLAKQSQVGTAERLRVRTSAYASEHVEQVGVRDKMRKAHISKATRSRSCAQRRVTRVRPQRDYDATVLQLFRSPSSSPLTRDHLARRGRRRDILLKNFQRFSFSFARSQ
jgi:hypothetical protein